MILLPLRAKAAFELAVAAAERLRHAHDHDTAEAAWIEFVLHANRAINLSGDPIRKPILVKVRTDPVGAYLREARNTEEHNGIYGSAKSIGQAARWEASPGHFSEVAVFGVSADGTAEWQSTLPGEGYEVVPATVRLIPVRNRAGDRIPVPQSTIAPRDPGEPLASMVAATCLEWLRVELGL